MNKVLKYQEQFAEKRFNVMFVIEVYGFNKKWE